MMTSEATTTSLPLDMRFNDGHVLSIVAYSVLMLVSGVGNASVFRMLRRRQRRRRSRVNHLFLHLATADLLVTFLLMPLEVAWAATVSWVAGDVACRVAAFFRVFGLYLSSFVLVCISVDRCLAVIKPLVAARAADRRVTYMLATAWIASALCSMPQSFIFHVERHPVHQWYHQCVTFNSFPSRTQEMAYNIFVMAAMYGCPLVVIVATYGIIIVKIWHKSEEEKEESHAGGTEVDSSSSGKTQQQRPLATRTRVGLRRSGPRTLRRARSKTLRMSAVFVAAFVLCWTPYYAICFLFWFRFQTAASLDPKVQKALFIFASSNSCINPIVYGSFMKQWDCVSGRRRQRRFTDKSTTNT